MEDTIDTDPAVVAEAYWLHPSVALLEEDVFVVALHKGVLNRITKIVKRLGCVVTPALVQHGSLRVKHLVKLDQLLSDARVQSLKLNRHVPPQRSLEGSLAVEVCHVNLVWGVLRVRLLWMHTNVASAARLVRRFSLGAKRHCFNLS